MIKEAKVEATAESDLFHGRSHGSDDVQGQGLEGFIQRIDASVSRLVIRILRLAEDIAIAEAGNIPSLMGGFQSRLPA